MGLLGHPTQSLATIAFETGQVARSMLGQHETNRQNIQI